MSGQYTSEKFDRTETHERTDQNLNSPEGNRELYTDRAPLADVLDPAMPVNETLDPAVPVDELDVQEHPQDQPVARQGPVDVKDEAQTTLLDNEVSEGFRTRWNEIQGMFVDEPRSAVQAADGLVSEVVEQITQMFTKEHTSLEGQWNQGNDVSTEDLRKALQRYRTFFNRLVV